VIPPADGRTPNTRGEGPAGGSDDSLTCALRHALRATPQAGSVNSPALKQAVQAFASAARTAGTVPERMLVALATCIAGGTSGTSDWWPLVLREQVVEWAIEAYYDVDRPAANPAPPQ
jgi:hypothetical protein